MQVAPPQMRVSEHASVVRTSGNPKGASRPPFRISAADQRQCRRWLADCEAIDLHSFCPNALELERALSAQGPPQSRHGGPPAVGRLAPAPYHPSADEVRREKAEARRREVRVLLDSAL